MRVHHFIKTADIGSVDPSIQPRSDLMDKVTPESVGFSPSRLTRIDAHMQRYVDKGKLSGIIAAIARRGQLAYREKFGQMDLEAGKPMELDTIFRIYSMSKPITSVAVMMLYEEGRFMLYDPVSRFIPGFKHCKVFARETESGFELEDLEREITILDLLTHTSGLSYGFEPEALYVDKLYQQRIWEARQEGREVALDELIREITRLPLAFQPGSAWNYSMATDVLGYLVQVVAELPFEQFLHERIFEPLGMVDTDFYVPEGKVDRFAALYGPAEGGEIKVLDGQTGRDYTRPTRCPSGGGGLVSTTADYMRFAQMMLNQGELDGTRLLGRKTVEWMTTNHLPLHLHPFEDPWRGFGLGVDVWTSLAGHPLGSMGRYGWGGAAGTRFWVDPQEELIGLLMIQFMPGGHYPIQDEFTVLVYQALVDG
jgi:CubicO group peptidase (beta-lactamase class C family)